MWTAARPACAPASAFATRAAAAPSAPRALAPCARLVGPRPAPNDGPAISVARSSGSRPISRTTPRLLGGGRHRPVRVVAAASGGGWTVAGKDAIVTDAASPSGLEIAAGLASQGCAAVVLACATMSEASAAKETLAARGVPAEKLVCEECDLAVRESVAAFAERMRQRNGMLGVLVHNAGVLGAAVEEPMLYSRWAYPSDFAAGAPLAYDRLARFDREMVVNHLGPFLLTLLLADAMVSNARVVLTTSEQYRRAQFEFECGRVVYRHRWDNRKNRPNELWFRRYNRSRLANVAFADEFNTRMRAKGLTTACLLVSLPWERDLVDPLPEGGRWAFRFANSSKAAPDAIAADVLHAATSPELCTQGNAETHYLLGQKEASVRVLADHAKMAKELYEWSERIARVGDAWEHMVNPGRADDTGLHFTPKSVEGVPMFDELTEEYRRRAAAENNGELPGVHLDEDRQLELAIEDVLRSDEPQWPRPLTNSQGGIATKEAIEEEDRAPTS